MSNDADQTPIDFAALAAPTEEHTQLEAFVGKFAAEVKIWMGPGEPMVTTGVMTNSMDLGGRFLWQTYQGDAVEGPFPSFAGRGYWGYNKTDKRWEGFWIDTGSTVMQVERRPGRRIGNGLDPDRRDDRSDHRTVHGQKFRHHPDRPGSSFDRNVLRDPGVQDQGAGDPLPAIALKPAFGGGRPQHLTTGTAVGNSTGVSRRFSRSHPFWPWGHMC